MHITVSEPAIAAAVAEKLGLDLLEDAPWNRKVNLLDDALADLVASIREHGILQPLIVRATRMAGGSPVSAKHAVAYQIVCGHRRAAAARQAGLETVPALVVAGMSDQAALELGAAENLHRENLSPLEEAVYFRRLMEAGLKTPAIAERVSRPVRYVHERLQLFSLGGPARDLLEAGTITAGHAVVLAKLSKPEQARAIKEALFQHEALLFGPDERSTGHQKPRTPAELQAWVDQHVRARPDAVDPVIFPEVVERLAEAPSKQKILPITYGHFVHPEAREGRTLTRPSWKRADGEQGSKTCEFSRLGFVAVGYRRGDAFLVCVDKDHCPVHWASERRARAKRAKARPAPGATPAPKARAKDPNEPARRNAMEEAARKEHEAIVREVVMAACTWSPEQAMRSALSTQLWNVCEGMELLGVATGHVTDTRAEKFLKEASPAHLQALLVYSAMEFGGTGDLPAFGVADYERRTGDAEKAAAAAFDAKLKAPPASPAKRQRKKK